MMRKVLLVIFSVVVMSSFVTKAEICSQCGSLIDNNAYFERVDRTEVKLRKFYELAFKKVIEEEHAGFISKYNEEYQVFENVGNLADAMPDSGEPELTWKTFYGFYHILK